MVDVVPAPGLLLPETGHPGRVRTRINAGVPPGGDTHVGVDEKQGRCPHKSHPGDEERYLDETGFCRRARDGGAEKCEAAADEGEVDGYELLDLVVELGDGSDLMVEVGLHDVPDEVEARGGSTAIPLLACHDGATMVEAP